MRWPALLALEPGHSFTCPLHPVVTFGDRELPQEYDNCWGFLGDDFWTVCPVFSAMHGSSVARAHAGAHSVHVKVDSDPGPVHAEFIMKSSLQGQGAHRAHLGFGPVHR